MSRPKLYIMVGLSASGKSTIAKEIAKEQNCIIVSSDSIRGEICDDGVGDQSKNEEVFKIFHNRIKEALLAGQNVIADATNIGLKSRRAILSMVSNISCEKIAYIVPKPVQACIEDNIDREYPVPHHVIKRQMSNFQIPFKEEGFDEIIIHKFSIAQYPRENFYQVVESMDGFEQKSKWHNLDLGAHCRRVSELFVETKKSYWYFIGSRVHDIGKLYVQTFDEDGYAHYYQHENVGAYYLLSEVSTFNEEFMLDALFIVNYHMMPMGWESDKAKNKWKKYFGAEKFQVLLDFNECDKNRD